MNLNHKLIFVFILTFVSSILFVTAHPIDEETILVEYAIPSFFTVKRTGHDKLQVEIPWDGNDSDNGIILFIAMCLKKLRDDFYILFILALFFFNRTNRI